MDGMSFWSESLGVILKSNEGDDAVSVQSLCQTYEWQKSPAYRIWSFAEDWTSLPENLDKDRLRVLHEDHLCYKALFIAESVIIGLSSELRNESISFLETMLAGQLSSDKLIDSLLMAPLVGPSSAERASKDAASIGCPCVASVFYVVHDYQPLLSKLTHCWLRLPNDFFNLMGRERQAVWKDLGKQGLIRKLIQHIGSKSSFNTVWLEATKDYPAPNSRKALFDIAREMSNMIFPGGSTRTMDYKAQNEETSSDSKSFQNKSVKDKAPSNFEQFNKVKKQIKAICDAIADGKDNNAIKFIDDLVDQQSDAPDLAVKSLCKIAQRSREIFRFDFEERCLGIAMKCFPEDPWALVQYGNHLKFLGKYDSAEDILNRALEMPGDEETKSTARFSIADLYTRRGDLVKAEERYRDVQGWENKDVARISLADIARRKNDFSSAEMLYDAILEEDPSADRAYAGKAEIYKQRGEFDKSEDIYRKLTAMPNLSLRQKAVYNTSLCHVLKLQGKYDDAYDLSDQVVKRFPFSMQARIQRYSIQGLLLRELVDLTDFSSIDNLPESPEFRWQSQFINGLLLFRISRYDEAKDFLLEYAKEYDRTEESECSLRLGAAMSFLQSGDTKSASNILSEIGTVSDSAQNALVKLWQFHLASRQSDHSQAVSLRKELQEGCMIYPEFGNIVKEAIKAIDNYDYDSALKFESQLLLLVAA